MAMDCSFDVCSQFDACIATFRSVDVRSHVHLGMTFWGFNWFGNAAGVSTSTHGRVVLYDKSIRGHRRADFCQKGCCWIRTDCAGPEWPTARSHSARSGIAWLSIFPDSHHGLAKLCSSYCGRTIECACMLHVPERQHQVPSPQRQSPRIRMLTSER